MKNCILTLFFITSFFATAQESKISVQAIDSLVIDADQYVGNDAYGDYYFIKNNVFFKINKNQNWEYKNVSLGKITKVDLQNPLKIILFYENFNTVIALDNQLNEVEKINFSTLSQDLVVSAIGMSSNNNFWVFNNLDQQLGLYNFLNNSYIRRGLPFTKSIKNYHSDFNYFYWIDSSNNLFDCDVFGKISFLAAIPDFDTVFIVNEKTVLFTKDSKLYYFDVVLNKVNFLKDVEKSIKGYYLQELKLVIFADDKLIEYKINLP